MPSRFRTIEVADRRFMQEGLLPVTFKSPSLKARADMTLFIPDGIDGEQNVPVVLLLHGVYGSHWAWSQKGGAHRTAARLIKEQVIPPMILAMPSDGLWGDGSGYLKHPHADFERYIVDDVPACVATVAPDGTVTAESPLFIAGLSMGGFGALRLGAKYAQRFRGISAHSSITHFSQMGSFIEEPLALYGPPPVSEQSVLSAMEANRAHLPPIRFDCGVDDKLIEHNRTLHRDLERLGIPHIYEEFPGAHEWSYWEKHLEDSLRFFGQNLTR